ncbi:MAG: serine/threonine-protein kinase [Anaerolineales bacterium]|nr:serine/threonine-protein kinase [Anaerolineales bacterium]
MTFQIGENIGPYRLVEKLGKGGMATVFKAYHARLDRYVAIKALHPAFMENEGFLDRFQREAKVVARLEHPHIVPIFDYSEHEERPYLVLKYVKGQTLKAYLSDRVMPFPEVRRIFEAVSYALVYAHQQGVLHRDIKPSNVLIEEGGQIFLADFGLARIAETSQTTMSAQMMMGTPHYISPEQAQGLADLDEGTDIYSLGVMMYELLVGEVPFQADTPFSVIHDHIYSPLPMPREINPDLTEEIQRVLLKSLAKSRADRYANLAEMVRDFLIALDRQIEQTGPQNPRKKAPVYPGGQANRQTGSAGAAYQPTVQVVQEASAPAHPRREKVKAGGGKFSLPGLTWWFVLPSLVLFFLAAAVVSSAAGHPGPDLITPPTLTQEAGQSFINYENEKTADLRAQISNHPRDPFLLIELGVELWQNGHQQEAEGYFKRAYEVAEKNPENYLQIGDLLADIGMWTYSTISYLQLEKHETAVPPDVVEDKIRRSAYYAGFEENSLLLLSRPEVQLDNDLLRLVETRKMILGGRMEFAELLINRIAGSRPDLEEVRLLRADLLLAQGNPEGAKIELNQLLQLEDLPGWIRDEAESKRRELNS